MANSTQATAGPRWSLALLSTFHAAVFAWAATVLPWRDWTVFSIVTTLLAGLHATTAALALAGSPRRTSAWRLTSAMALAYLAFYTYVLVDAATYIAALYGGLGEGLAAAIAAVWAVVVLLTLPLSVWGLAATGGVPWGRGPRIVTSGIAALAALGLLGSARAASPKPVATPASEAVVAAIPRADARAAPPERSLFTRTPARCARPPGDGVPTLIVTYLRVATPPDAADSRVVTRCLQDERAAALPGLLTDALADAHPRSPVKVDLVVGVSPLASRGRVLDGLSIRPGLDGVCAGRRCLMPWQLVAFDQFTSFRPLPFIDDLRFGSDPDALGQALAGFRPREDYDGPAHALDGWTRVATASFMTDARGELREATRMRLVDVALDRPALTRAVETAVAHILASQAEDGRFRYLLDPYTGRSSWRGFGIPRQAGTTLALCEVGPRSAEVDAAAAKSLAMMASAAHEVAGERAAIAYEAPGRKVRRASLGSTALALVAFLSCRDRVGDRHDRLIGMLARLLISMQRDDGGFAPVFDLAAARPLDGPTPMYAEGQVVFGLSLAEALAGELGDGGPLPEVAALRDAVERAMSYVAHDYWDHGLRDFFFVEENWHCLAARASLGHHRNRDYERFCVDYVAFKARIIYDEDSRVRFDLVGGYGFGNVLPPHNTPTGGYGEALAAAMALKRADGLDTSEDDARMARALKFLVRQQWSADNCFACAPEHVVIGGFSESMASPILRIDYVQHTLSGLGHGGRLLGLLDPPAPAPDAS